MASLLAILQIIGVAEALIPKAVELIATVTAGRDPTPEQWASLHEAIAAHKAQLLKDEQA